MSSSPALESPSPSHAPPPPEHHFHTSTPNAAGKSHIPLHVVLPSGPSTPPIHGEATPTPPPRSPGAASAGDARPHHPPDGTSSDKSSETAVGGGGGGGGPALSRKESYKAQRQHYRREKKRAASALLHSIEDPAIVVLADWLKSSETAVGGGGGGGGPALSRKESYKAQRQHYRREKKRAASALLHSIEDPAIVVLADWLKSSETAVGGGGGGGGPALSRKESYKAQRQHYRREKKRAASALLHSIEDPAIVVLADWLKSSETAVGGGGGGGRPALSRKESYKAQRQHYRREKKRAASALLHSIEDPAIVVLADWLKVRGSLKSWTKLWCVLKPGLLLLYKSSKAKSSHWVGTVLLTSCQVIERPSKKDGFCFKLYHPLEQSIWAPRGPHNETIGAVVQPLPTAHLIFRAPSQAAGHCWLDGLELALKCSNAMLRCSRPREGGAGAATAAGAPGAVAVTHEDLERHFHEHVAKLSRHSPSSSPAPVMSVADYSPHPRNTFRGRQVESIDEFKDSSDQSLDREKSIFDFDFPKAKDSFEERGEPLTSSIRTNARKLVKQTDDLSATSARGKEMARISPILRCFELPKAVHARYEKRAKEKTISPSSFLEENLSRLVGAFPKRRCSAPPTDLFRRGETHPPRTDSDNDETPMERGQFKRLRLGGTLETDAREGVIITTTAPSLENSRRSSSTDVRRLGCGGEVERGRANPEKYSLIDYGKVPSARLRGRGARAAADRCLSQKSYFAGKIVVTGGGKLEHELEGASDSESEASAGGGGAMAAAVAAVQRTASGLLRQLAELYVEDTEDEVGASGELVEEIAEENKSLLWFLVKQVRPGMDLSKVVLPTFILEPRSFLDKLSDNYYHADILAGVSRLEDPYQRFVAVLRWYLSGLYRKPRGLKKPYNPVLGELFRCSWRHPESGTRTYYIAEQVSHHPPLSAFYVSNRKEGFIIEGSILAKSKFYGNSTSAILEGSARLVLVNRGGETYVSSAPYAHCKGLVVGTLSMELGGKVMIVCQSTGYHAEIDFKLKSFLGGADQTNAISGRIRRGKDTVATIDGYWDAKIDIREKKTGEEYLLVDCSVLKERRLRRSTVREERQHEFESQRMWRGVSRAIINEDQVAATEEKTLIEEAQRERARANPNWVPRHFRKDEPNNTIEGVVDQGWRYNHTNTDPWGAEELIEYEEDFVVRSLRAAAAAGAPPAAAAPPAPLPPLSRARLSDSDSPHDDSARRSKLQSRNLRKTLQAIEASMREHAHAVERLRAAVEALGAERRAPARSQRLGAAPARSHAWDLVGGFALAMLLQALLNWVFFR